MQFLVPVTQNMNLYFLLSAANIFGTEHFRLDTVAEVLKLEVGRTISHYANLTQAPDPKLKI